MPSIEIPQLNTGHQTSMKRTGSTKTESAVSDSAHEEQTPLRPEWFAASAD
ncbi:MAG: hypothetical protein ACI96M_004151 [Candidatus Azotimanducaceae bacterium]|jgi:hypothetical protein